MNHMFKLKDSDVKIHSIYVGDQVLNDNLDNDNIIYSMSIIQQHISLFNRIKLLNLDNKIVMNRIIQLILRLYDSGLLENYKIENSTLISTLHMMSLKYLKLAGNDVRFYNKSNQELIFEAVNEYEYDDILRIGIVLRYLWEEDMKLLKYIMSDDSVTKDDIRCMKFFWDDGYDSENIECFIRVLNLVRGDVK